ncbi:MAG: 3-hydroxy-3-methylglutaryl CoA synthase, partial [SAR86 cluster bacterium]
LTPADIDALRAADIDTVLAAKLEDMDIGENDAAAAIAVGSEAVLAEFLGAATVATDFVDHYRDAENSFSYDWEERWIRDESFFKSVPAAVSELLQQTQTQAEQIAHFIMPSDQPRTPAAVAKKLAINPAALVDNQLQVCGVAGAAQPLLLLAKVLERAKPGELILVIGFGQGCDALLFRATDQIAHRKPIKGVSGALSQRREELNYNKFLSFNNLVERDIGKRGEADKQTYLSALNRRKDLLTAFIGGKCRDCQTVQIPRENYCVNPDCGALDSQDPYEFSNLSATVKTWTADRLTFDWNPPAYFGLVEFEGGGRLMMDFTEVEAGQIDTGTKMTMCFRIKQLDAQRGFRKYFWKATPS